LVIFLILLILGTALLFWFLGSRQRPRLTPATAVSSIDSAVGGTRELVPNFSEPAVSTDTGKVASAVASRAQIQQIDGRDLLKTTEPDPVLRDEKQVYRFRQLPVSIQNRIPPLQMSLHAYNRNDSGASMVQLNGEILQEGDAVTETLKLEKISAAGAILNYAGYRFLLPRQGN
jgi:hypothetical protein